MASDRDGPSRPAIGALGGGVLVGGLLAIVAAAARVAEMTERRP